MTGSEMDLETIEAFLDGELSDSQRRDFDVRLAGDTAFAAAVASAQQERAIRATLWQAMEPTTVEADRLTWRVRGAMLNHNRRVEIISKPRVSSWRLAGVGSAAAACLLVGFVTGRANRTTPVRTPAAVPVNVAQTDPAPDAGKFVKFNGAPSSHLVPIVENGRIVAWQPFNDEEKAKNFAEDMNRVNSPADSGPIKLADHEERF